MTTMCKVLLAVTSTQRTFLIQLLCVAFRRLSAHCVAFTAHIFTVLFRAHQPNFAAGKFFISDNPPVHHLSSTKQQSLANIV